METSSSEYSALSKERRGQTLLEAAMVVAGLYSFFTGGTEPTPPVSNSPTVSETGANQIGSYTLTSDIDGWVLDCSGTQTVVVDAENPETDTLYDLIATNVYVQNSASLDTPNIPPAALADAIAELSGIENENLVHDNQEITLPLRCQPGPIPG